jgi:hypothetical protein
MEERGLLRLPTQGHMESQSQVGGAYPHISGDPLIDECSKINTRTSFFQADT